MKLVVIVQQEENWEDDGGAHDPVLVQVSDEDLAFLQGISPEGDDYYVVTDAENERVNQIIEHGLVPEWRFPCEIHGVFNIWWSCD